MGQQVIPGRVHVSGLHLLGGGTTQSMISLPQNCSCLMIPEILDNFPSFFFQKGILIVQNNPCFFQEIPGTTNSMGMKLGKVGRGSLYLEDHPMTCNWLVRMVPVGSVLSRVVSLPNGLNGIRIPY